MGDQTDINVIAWWIVILILAFASIGAYTFFQIVRTIWKKEPPPNGLADGWPEGRFCMLLRVPRLGKPAVVNGSPAFDEPAVVGKLRVEIRLVEEQPDGSSIEMKAQGEVSGASGGPYHRMYSWDATTGDLTAEQVA